MKKGDDRRNKILQTAEQLFYSKGYENTSIQDILDEMKLSKGGFYHHFESKLQLLEALCERQMAENGEKMRRAVADAQGDAVAQLNALYEYCTFWQEGQAEFTSLVLRAAYEGGSVQIRDTLKQTMLTGARPLIREIIHAGVEQGKFFSRYVDDIGELLLLLFANLNDEIAMRLAADEGGNSLNGILTQLKTYRHAAELLTGAPYGSLVLYDLNRFPAIIDSVFRHRKQMNA